MHDLKAVSSLFDLRGDFVHGYSYGSGHINDTYCIWVDQAGQRLRYILQRVNQHVFKQPIPLMENVKRVTDHALKRLKEEQCPEAYRRTLTLVPSVDGKPYALDADGNCWRVYPFIERARTYDQIETTRQCQEAARAFGEFQKLTADLPGEPLFETIPDFHNTTSRLAALKEAIQSDPLGRVKEVQKEIDWYLSREADCHLVVDSLKSGVSWLLEKLGIVSKEAAKAKLPESVTRQQPATVNADGKVMMPSGGFPSWGYGFAGMYDSGGYIPRGQFGIVGENGPEIVNGPANVTSRRNTAALAAVVAGMMGVAAAPAELPPLHPLALPAKGGEAIVSRAATVPPVYRIEAPTQIIIQTQPGQSAQDIAREVARQLDERERRLKAKARSNYSDQGGYDA